MKNIIPKHKSDIKAVENLDCYIIAEISEEIPLLLEWLKDCNWPVAHPIYTYFRRHINEIDEHIISIFRSDDGMWKYWIVGLIADAEQRPNHRIINILMNLVANPTIDEIESEVNSAAKEFLDKLKS